VSTALTERFDRSIERARVTSSISTKCTAKPPPSRTYSDWACFEPPLDGTPNRERDGEEKRPTGHREGPRALNDGIAPFAIHLRRFADGRSQQIEYIAEYDREYPVTGTDEYDHLLLKRIDEYTAEAVLTHANKVYGTARRRISPDGKTMTITFRRDLGGSGVPVTNVSVYDKETE
jgi:hypothetical protein